MERNKLIHRSDEQKALYKALTDAYESDKVILIRMEILSQSNDIEMMRKNPSLDQTRGLREEELEKNLSLPVHQRRRLPSQMASLKKGPNLIKSLLASQQYLHDLRKPLPLIPNSQGHHVIPFDHFINNDLKYLKGGASSQTYATLVTKTKAADYGHIKWIEDLVSNTTNDDKLYTFKDGDYKRLRLQDIEDMLLLLIQGVESYQKKLNLIRPDMYRSDVKRLPTYSAYRIPRGFIYQNKENKNRLMRINELYKFSDGTLNDVRTALDDILKRIRMKYLPKTYWRNIDKERAGLRFRRLMNSSRTKGP
nr:hypothetical protein [Tanacetum cinerariifolium]